MKKLYWKWDTIHSPIENYDMNVEDFIQPCTPQSSAWWLGLPKFTENVKNIWINRTREKHINIAEPPFTVSNNVSEKPSTVKSCPGILEIFKKSYIVKCPHDLSICITEDMRMESYSPSAAGVSIQTHPFSQLKSSYNMFAERINIKFMIPILITSDLPYVFLNPTYHCNNIWDVMPGVVDSPWNKDIQLNVNTLINLKDLEFKDGVAEISIREKQPLCYMWFPEKTKLIHSNKKPKQKTFLKL